jgi:GcrA cell cycle regulator
MGAHPGKEWPAERIERLRAYWAAGLPVRAIGRLLDVSCNAVTGKARRLHLAPRPSPIRRDRPQRRRIPRAGKVTLPVLPSLAGFFDRITY